MFGNIKKYKLPYQLSFEQFVDYNQGVMQNGEGSSGAVIYIFALY